MTPRLPDAPTPVEVVIGFFAVLSSVSTALFGAVIYLAYKNPDRGYHWIDFLWGFLGSLGVTIFLVILVAYFFRRRMSGSGIDIGNE